MSTHIIASTSQLPVASARRFDVEGHAIVVVRFADAIYAIGDTCSHADVSLSEGEVLAESCEIECWKHGSAFSLRTGEPSTLPATQPVAVYAVSIHGDDVVVEMP